MNTLPEWSDLRFFLELARAGTLSGAWRRPDAGHATAARRIGRLEKERPVKVVWNLLRDYADSQPSVFV